MSLEDPTVPLSLADAVTLTPKRFHTAIQVSLEYAEEIRAMAELARLVMERNNREMFRQAMLLEDAIMTTPPESQ